MKRLVVTTITALGLASVAPAVAQGPTVNLTIGKLGPGPEGTTTTVRYGERVELSGELSNGQPNQLVDLRMTPYRGETRVVTVRTDASGDFTFVHRPTIRTSYEARFGSTPSNQEPFAHVRPSVGLRVLNARRGLFRVGVAARPEHVSRVVLFQRRISRTSWATVRRVRLRSSTLRARFSARIPRGTHRVRILVPQTPGYLRATSAFVRITR
jgi:hypothetical protein